MTLILPIAKVRNHTRRSEVLKALRTGARDAKAVARKIHCSREIASTQLNLLVSDGKIQRSQRGKYRPKPRSIPKKITFWFSEFIA